MTPRRPLRVLMITSDHLMIDRRILQEAGTLHAAGYAVEILAGFECPEPQDYAQGGVRIRRFAFDWSDPRMERVLAPLRLMPDRLRTLVRRAARRVVARLTGRSSFEDFVLRTVMACDYDILHCHDYPLLAVAVEAKRRRPTPLVYDAHELYHAQIQLPASTRRRYRAREKRLIRRADLTITVNPLIARHMADDYGCALPEVILNAAPARDRADARPGLRQRLGLRENDRIVLYQGWFSPERGIDRLVAAARYFAPRVHLILIGYGEYERELKAISERQGTDDGRVIFFGRVETADLDPLTRSADLGVIPYRAVDLNNTYCSPNKLFEYAVAALPFVCNDLPFLRAIVEAHGFGVLADLDDPEAAARAMLAVLDDPERLDGLRRAAEQAGRVLNWDVEGEKLLALYRRITAAMPAPE